MPATEPKRIIVVGGLAAGPSAAAKAARTNPHAEVILLEATENVSYGICESPYLLGGTLEDESRLVTYTPERLREQKRIDVRTLHLVETIVPAKRTVVVRNFRRRTTEELRYDALVLATGAVPRALNVEHESARNVFRLHLRDDVQAMERFIATEHPSEVVIVGGGYIGMEMAEAFRKRGCAVTIVHRHALPLGGIEEHARTAVLEELQKNGVRFIPEAGVEGFVPGKDARVGHVVTTRGSLPCDIVLLATGVVPNAGLARAANLRLGPAGGIVTDRRQQTSADRIYAAGDCCEVRHLITGKPVHIPLATIASKTGWVAGENAAGKRSTFEGAIRAAAVKVFGLEVAVAGLTSDEAARAGFTVVRETVTAHEKIAFYPGATKLTITLVAERRSGRILGATLIGATGAALRANVVSTAIHRQSTAADLARMDFVYAPPYAPLWDPLLIAAQQLAKKV